ncbi:lipoprotein [Campylobacter jejuni subsp. doylei]|uniref:Lipoprotein n=1 Tax=Campylobacter jejuni subsp. doylei TaxID=32021 RepID=A0A448JD38_CAMJU|nr:lipoprotein [Campylobacter jejuni subsp. doylei]
MPTMIAKALVQTIVKTTLNVAVANNDYTGGWLSLATAVATAATNKADVRSFAPYLPASVAIMEK